MAKSKDGGAAKEPDALFDRIVTILEKARGNVVRAVNTGMVTAYWLIGREIVEALQDGAERAEYGKQVVERLSVRLTERYGKGFSKPVLWSFRQFYLTYSDRAEILFPAGRELAGVKKLFPPGRESAVPEKRSPSGTESEFKKVSPLGTDLGCDGIRYSPGDDLSVEENPHPKGGESTTAKKPRPAGVDYAANNEIPSPSGRELAPAEKQYPSGTKFGGGFLPELSWSHYRALMRVEDGAARAFYEREAADCGWSKAQLERQIHTAYYERIVAHRGVAEGGATERERLPGEPIGAADVLKSPYVLEFLGLPDAPELHESAFEQAIIDNLQTFLLELGKGFAFVARQRHIRFDGEDFYIDLVFYNFILKCFLLIDLKIGKLTHRDVGQMDGYVRLFEDRFKTDGDNPTIGLILCSDKGEAVAKYSVLSEGRQIFASKYLQFLPSEEDLQREIERERKMIETALEDEQNAD